MPVITKTAITRALPGSRRHRHHTVSVSTRTAGPSGSDAANRQVTVNNSSQMATQ